MASKKRKKERKVIEVRQPWKFLGSILPVAVAIASTALTIMAGIELDPPKLGNTSDARRFGTAHIQDCHSSFTGLTYKCSATIEWEPEDRWENSEIVKLNSGPIYVVKSRYKLSGTVGVIAGAAAPSSSNSDGPRTEEIYVWPWQEVPHFPVYFILALIASFTVIPLLSLTPFWAIYFLAQYCKKKRQPGDTAGTSSSNTG